MTRKELAQQVYMLLKRTTPKKGSVIWQAIAETDDKSLITEYERLIEQNYVKKESENK